MAQILNNECLKNRYGLAIRSLISDSKTFLYFLSQIQNNPEDLSMLSHVSSPVNCKYEIENMVRLISELGSGLGLGGLGLKNMVAIVDSKSDSVHAYELSRLLGSNLVIVDDVAKLLHINFSIDVFYCSHLNAFADNLDTFVDSVDKKMSSVSMIIIKDNSCVESNLFTKQEFSSFLQLVYATYESVGALDKCGDRCFHNMMDVRDAIMGKGFSVKCAKYRGNVTEKYLMCATRGIRVGGRMNNNKYEDVDIDSKFMKTYRNAPVAGLYDNDKGGKKDNDVFGSADVDKPPELAAVIPTDISTECSIVSDGNKVCMSDETAKKLASVVGVKAVIGDGEEEKEKVVEVAKQATGCDSERCVLSHTKIANALGQRVVGKELAENFKIIGHTDVTWLNNFDIDATLHQWSVKFKDFYHCKFSMVDFDRENDEFSRVDLAYDVYDAGKRTFGCIINTDVYSGRGKHWMAMFVDMRDGSNSMDERGYKDFVSDKSKTPKWSIEFFNSSGNDPAASWKIWMNNQKNKLQEYSEQKKLPVTVETVIVADRVRHQESQTECGVYALFYIWCRLNDIPYHYFSENIVPDKHMFEMRYHLFYDPTRPALPTDGNEIRKFKYGIYEQITNIKWEDQ